MSGRTWVITSNVNDSQLFAGFYNDHREGKGKVNCVPIYMRHVEFDNRAFAEALTKVLNNFDVRDFRVISPPSEERKEDQKQIDDRKAWQDVW